MRKNEYNSLLEFTNEYVGEWSPSNGHWLGLDFLFNGTEYRLHTGSMYNEEDTVLPDGRVAVFGLYKLTNKENHTYDLLGEYADMQELLKSDVIDNTSFKDIIMYDETVILGKD